MNQKQINQAVVTLQMFLVSLAFECNANLHELEEITKRALLEIEVEDP